MSRCLDQAGVSDFRFLSSFMGTSSSEYRLFPTNDLDDCYFLLSQKSSVWAQHDFGGTSDVQEDPGNDVAMPMYDNCLDLMTLDMLPTSTLDHSHTPFRETLRSSSIPPVGLSFYADESSLASSAKDPLPELCSKESPVSKSYCEYICDVHRLFYPEGRAWELADCFPRPRLRSSVEYEKDLATTYEVEQGSNEILTPRPLVATKSRSPGRRPTEADGNTLVCPQDECTAIFKRKTELK